MSGQHRIIVGISGATGIVLGARALELLREAGIETHLVVTRHSQQTRALETCSVRSLAEIAGGATSSLLTRAADVMLKERQDA